MKKWISTLIVLLLFFLLQIPINAKEKNNWETLDVMTNYAWQLSKQKKFDEAKQLLLFLENEFKENNVENRLSINELRVISASYEKALDAVENDGMSYEDRIDKVTQFRLVVDAILSEHQPLWSTMEEPIMTTFAELKTEMEKEDWAAFQHEWNRFLSLYSVIYPSLTVDVDSKNIDKIETHISAVNDKMFFEISKKTRQKHMMEIEKDLKNIFDRVKNDEADPSLLWVMFSTGSVIFIALAYTGWKKYKGEKTDKRKEN
ncbi:MAG: sporulation protein YpjB [Bacillaceae bacterium]|jgi:sporulation protein YpjB|uniref:Sporulation protein YpjB n=2 Tax=Aeribacillus TaxID=1055323 RepID=A0A165XB93_9BACI|nr:MULTISPECIES: sporulation protein YpjB [Aeribacillus]REJ20463.1 MAG: sporulation protein YpjB [Bacillaceae bacterium]ASS91719.1 sporulation protein YpjB [Aeribacillus pallidus]KZM52680.1 hypothetical protein A3Q35_03705 [Aeribacillus pallidus]KZN95828.1 hypothetical protein AZI98_12200 [Aeribacillus pallidus]MDR9792936.1 sporulation protein YpjB [Aeribacillus pallidus]